MSILIKGVKITDCWNCPCIDGEYGECNILGKTIKSERGRLDDCPLIELPDHGDLIDRDALMAHKGSAYDIDGHELYAVGTGTILRMPVIISAERSEE